MNPQANNKRTVGCLTVLLIVMLVTTYLATSSLNPLAVYSSRSMVAKIVVTLTGLLLLVGIFQLFAIILMRLYLRIMAGKPADDLICPGCGLSLIQYISSHGQPIPCPKCHSFWHNGPACYCKGLDQQMMILPTVPCPRCRRAASHLRDLQSDLEDIVK